MPQKLTTTACFIQEESSGGRQFRKHVSCFYAQGGNVGVLSLHSFLYLGFLPEIYFCVGKLHFRSSVEQAIVFLFKILSFSSKHKLHLLHSPV